MGKIKHWIHSFMVLNESQNKIHKRTYYGKYITYNKYKQGEGTRKRAASKRAENTYYN